MGRWSLWEGRWLRGGESECGTVIKIAWEWWNTGKGSETVCFGMIVAYDMGSGFLGLRFD